MMESQRNRVFVRLPGRLPGLNLMLKIQDIQEIVFDDNETYVLVIYAQIGKAAMITYVLEGVHEDVHESYGRVEISEQSLKHTISILRQL